MKHHLIIFTSFVLISVSVGCAPSSEGQDKKPERRPFVGISTGSLAAALIREPEMPQPC